MDLQYGKLPVKNDNHEKNTFGNIAALIGVY